MHTGTHTRARTRTLARAHAHAHTHAHPHTRMHAYPRTDARSPGTRGIDPLGSTVDHSRAHAHAHAQARTRCLRVLHRQDSFTGTPKLKRGGWKPNCGFFLWPARVCDEMGSPLRAAGTVAHCHRACRLPRHICAGTGWLRSHRQCARLTVRRATTAHCRRRASAPRVSGHEGSRDCFVPWPPPRH